MTDRKFTPPTEFPAEYVTRDGRRAVILARMPASAGSEEYCGFVDPCDQDASCSWHAEGQFLRTEEFKLDLQDLPPVRKRWMNVYPIRMCSMFRESRISADRAAGPGRIGVIRIEQVEGQMPTFHEEEV